MRQLKIGNRTITDNDVFIVAEIGCNHMGDLSLAEKMVREAARCGADAVKFQVRDNARMFTKSLLELEYNNELSYGRTYGEHRAALDWFGGIELETLQCVAEKWNVLFFATPFEEKSADLLEQMDVPLYKIASCDVTNIPLVQHVAEFGKPIIISTGGAALDEIDELVRAIEPINPNFAILHCISLYPNTDKVLNLRTITLLKHKYPKTIIGFSSHHPGLLPLYIARTLGASIFEVHFTMNRGSKGTDHGFSLEPNGLRTLCEDLKRIRPMIGSYEKLVHEPEKTGFVLKFGKGLYLRHPLEKGSIIKQEDICIKAPAGDIKPHKVGEIIGKMLKKSKTTETCLKGGDFD